MLPSYPYANFTHCFFFPSSVSLLLLRISVNSSNQKMFLSPNLLSLPSYIYIFSLCFNLHLDHQTTLVYFFHTFVLSPHLLSSHSYFISLGFTLLKYQFPVCTRFSLPFQKENMLLHMFVLINFPHTFHLKNSFYLLALVFFPFLSVMYTTYDVPFFSLSCTLVLLFRPMLHIASNSLIFLINCSDSQPTIKIMCMEKNMINISLMSPKIFLIHISIE